MPLLSPTSSTVQRLQGSVQQRDCQVIPADDDLTALFFLGEHETQGSGDHALLGHWKPLEQIASQASATRYELESAPFPNGALHLVADRISESLTLACGQIVVEQAGKENHRCIALCPRGKGARRLSGGFVYQGQEAARPQLGGPLDEISPSVRGSGFGGLCCRRTDHQCAKPQ